MIPQLESLDSNKYVAKSITKTPQVCALFLVAPFQTFLKGCDELEPSSHNFGCPSVAARVELGNPLSPKLT